VLFAVAGQVAADRLVVERCSACHAGVILDMGYEEMDGAMGDTESPGRCKAGDLYCTVYSVLQWS